MLRARWISLARISAAESKCRKSAACMQAEPLDMVQAKLPALPGVTSTAASSFVQAAQIQYKAGQQGVSDQEGR